MYVTVDQFQVDIPDTEIALQVDIVRFGEQSNALIDCWEYSPKHIGGVTVRFFGDNYTAYYIPRFCSLAELASQLSKEGAKNPSKEAYERLKYCLECDASSYSCGFQFTARVAGQEIITKELCAYGFDWSDLNEGTILDYGRECFMGGAIDECKALVQERNGGLCYGL